MNCLICNNSNSSNKTTFRQLYPQGGDKFIYLDWYLCSNCKGIFCYPQPTFEEIEKYWTTVSYIKPELKDEYKSLKSQIYNRILFHIKKSTKINSEILDFGSNFGQFLEILRDNNLIAEGFDINENAIKISQKKGFKVYNSESELTMNKAKFDAINANDVFCYVDIPYKWLQYYFDLLKNNGVLILRLTNKILYFKIFYYLLPNSEIRNKILSHILQDQFHMVSMKTLGKIGKKIGFQSFSIDTKARTAPAKYYSFLGNSVYFFSTIIYYISFKQINLIPGVLLILKKS